MLGVSTLVSCEAAVIKGEEALLAVKEFQRQSVRDTMNFADKESVTEIVLQLGIPRSCDSGLDCKGRVINEDVNC
jgi:hypothetical protein